MAGYKRGRIHAGTDLWGVRVSACPSVDSCNLDPLTIQVLSRNDLWIKLTDIAPSGYVDLGKPDGYHAIYASQPLHQAEKSTADIWSAGVVALQILPDGLPPHRTKDQSRWVERLQDVARDRK